MVAGALFRRLASRVTDQLGIVNFLAFGGHFEVKFSCTVSIILYNKELQ
jgi:hypothetical protein